MTRANLYPSRTVYIQGHSKATIVAVDGDWVDCHVHENLTHTESKNPIIRYSRHLLEGERRKKLMV